MSTPVADIRAAAYTIRGQLRQLGDQHQGATIEALVNRAHNCLDSLLDNLAELDQLTRAG